MNVTVSKDMRGAWRAENVIELGNNRILTISTHKTFSGNLVTTATVGKREGAFVSHMMFTDFSKQCALSKPARTTSKVVAEQHGNVMALKDDIVREAVAFYTPKEKVAA